MTKEITVQEKIYRLGRELPISKPIDGWQPPDTAELTKINNLLNQIGDRLQSLRIAVLLNEEKENGRIRRVLASRKRGIEKAFQKGRTYEKKLRAKRHYL